MSALPAPTDGVSSWEAMVRGLDGRLAETSRDPGPVVVLVGPMGAGKTTVGRALAAATGRVFVDSDALFEDAFGSIPAYFTSRGEPEFRRQEERVIAHVLAHPAPCVLACGGGAVLSAATRARLADPRAVVVSLQVAEPEALRRLGGGAGRPVLAGDPAGRWKAVLAERAPLYAEVADLTLDGTGHRPGDIASRIVEAIPTLPRRHTRP